MSIIRQSGLPRDVIRVSEKEFGVQQSLLAVSGETDFCLRTCGPAGAFGHRAPAGDTEAGRQNG